MAKQRKKSRFSVLGAALAKLPSIRETPASKTNTKTLGQPSTRPATEPFVDEVGEAQALLHAGKVDKAADAFQTVLSRGANLEAHIGLIRDYQRRREWTEGLQEAEVALAGFPDSAALAALKGELLLALNRIDEAEALYAPIKEKFPRNVAGFAGLATVASRRRDWGKASSRWQNCLDCFPDHSSVPDWRTSLGNALLELGRLDEAEAEFNIVCKHLPSDARGFAGMAWCAHRRRSFEEASVQWQACSDRFPDHSSAPTWRAQLGTALLELGRLDDAEAVFVALRESEPTRPEGFAGMARCAHRSGDFERAWTRWQDCIERFPTHPYVSNWRARHNECADRV